MESKAAEPMTTEQLNQKLFLLRVRRDEFREYLEALEKSIISSQDSIDNLTREINGVKFELEMAEREMGNASNQ